MAGSSTIGRRIGKIVAWIVAIIVILVIALTVFILTFDWNRARPYVNDKVTQAIGRQFTINGDLRVGLRHPVGETGWKSWVPWPRFSAANITIANPDWAKRPQFATLDEIDFQVKVLPLLAHDIVIPAINLVNPSVDLERMMDGRNNWTFELPKSKTPSQWKLQLHDIVFAKGNIALSDEQKKVDAQIVVDTLGQPIPIGEALKQQEQASRKASAEAVGKEGAKKLSAQADAQAASAASAAAAAAASGASSTDIHASGTTAATGASGGLVAGGSKGASAVTGASGAALASASGAPGASAAGVVGGTSDASGTSGTSGASATTAANGRPRDIPPYAIGWTLKGTYNKTPVSGSGKVGGVLALQDANRPFPVQADVKAGDLHVGLVGTITDPAHLAAVDLRLWVQGSSMAKLYSLTGVTLPDTPPYATEGRFVGQFKTTGNVFKYENFTGRVGGSDLNGSLIYTARQPRPLLQGELESRLLQFSDLAPVIGADSNASKAKRGDGTMQPSNKALPVEEFRTDRWKAIDADVKFTGRRIVKNADLPITDLYTHIVMTNGVLSLEPLKFGVAGGTLASNIHLDGSGAPLKARFATSARHLKLKQLFPNFKTMQDALGEINGDAALTATGNSPAALAATSNGEVKALVTEGTVSRLLMEAAGLNVANVVYEKLFGNRDVKINCAAADFVATDGVLESRVFALDTDDAVIDIDGHVNMRDETMDLGVHPHTKGFRVFSLRSPLYAKGTFKNPHVGVNAAALALRGGAAVGLGLVNPFAALLPLLAPSNNKPLPCAQLLSQVRQAPKAPPPGTKQPPKPAISLEGAPVNKRSSAGAAASAPASASAPAGRKAVPASPASAAEYKGS
ncbi:AsmA family protein [Paraburkholderia phenoliruptrix]|uniref:AsmA family protein n=1 Tax=Paraburkholderia phenoliruptrix TaxID=252970 RepID=UPI001C6E69BA|nr:AsmA family protein [Paraburkholderia phenoliruptrix]MBW9104024.1 AsmA family protein [Paraburkholderia phenoliruptrix]MBW9130610.1 AsmA family protein [Paraburkholderia ginsengiterrae]